VKTVLFFAYACAPYNRPESTIGGQRPAKFAKFLPRFGWRAIVLCADARTTTPPKDGEIEARVVTMLDEAALDRSIIIPLASMRSDGLLDDLWRRFAARGPIWSVVRRPLTLTKFLTGDYSQNWQPSARIAAQLLASRTRIDACVGEHSPDAGLFLARWFSDRYRVPWIADFRDPFLLGQRVGVRPLLKPFARRLVRTATHVIAFTPPSVEIDSRLLDRPVELIENGFDPEEFDGPLEPRGEAEFVVVLTGSIWIQSDLERFLRGMALLRDRIGPELSASLRFRYVGGDHQVVLDLARRIGVEDLVDSRGRVPREVALRLTRDADVLLVISPMNHPDPYWAKGAYPGKVFEYLGARRPILAVPAGNRPLEELLGRTRAGSSASTPEEIAAYLEAAWRQWRSTGALAFTPDEAAVAQYSRIRSAEKLAALLDGSVGARETESRAA
jgi:hypothetical protein